MVSVEVTQEDITNGDPNIGDSCPIALACRRVFPGAKIFVGRRFVTLEQFEIITKYSLPPAGIKFVHNFDVNNPVLPTTVVLKEIPFEEH